MGGIGFQELLILIPLFLLYFLPTIIARNRKHKNRLLILGLNIAIGWTVLGWFVILVWSFIDNKK